MKFILFIIITLIISVKSEVTGKSDRKAGDGLKLIIKEKDTNKTCLLFSFSQIELNIRSNNLTKHNHLKHVIDLKNVVKELYAQNCVANHTQCISLITANTTNKLQFCFKMDHSNSSYKLNSLKFSMRNLTFEIDQNSNTTNLNLTVPFNSTYSCVGTKKIVFNETKNWIQSIETKIMSLKFSAFRNTNDTNWNEIVIKDCEEKFEHNSLIPLIIGGVLTGFLITSLCLYFVLRQRKY